MLPATGAACNKVSIHLKSINWNRREQREQRIFGRLQQARIRKAGEQENELSLFSLFPPVQC
jgi:hypothetical protein